MGLRSRDPSSGPAELQQRLPAPRAGFSAECRYISFQCLLILSILQVCFPMNITKTCKQVKMCYSRETKPITTSPGAVFPWRPKGNISYFVRSLLLGPGPTVISSQAQLVPPRAGDFSGQQEMVALPALHVQKINFSAYDHSPGTLWRPQRESSLLWASGKAGEKWHLKISAPALDSSRAGIFN